jgi:hypothetical protein
MWRRIASMIFGSSVEQAPQQFAPVPMDRQPTPSGNDPSRKPWRTVGLTEQRLRERNRESWITSTKGWSEMLGRFSSK